jgi:hypothetical protein
MSGVIKELYRRGADFYTSASEVNVTGGVTYTWTFNNPGWVAFDFMCNIPLPSNGELPDKWFKVTVDGVLRFKVRGGWTWTRYWLFVDAGTHNVRFYTEDYSGSDYAKIRRINCTDFPKVSEYVMLESTSMPKPIESINVFPILQGWQRYQRSGPKGTELEFIIVFDDIQKWRTFMSKLQNHYIVKGDYGVYGGVILPQETDTVRKGNLILMKCKFNSPMTAGVGVDGL